jgi:secreted trypsin-like serine protease
MRKVLGFVLVGALGGCAPSSVDAAGDGGSSSADIIGGARTSSHPAVMALFAGDPRTGSGALCTASLIAPRVLLTAAHCVSAEEVGADAQFLVLTGGDVRKNPTSRLAVDSVLHDSAFSAHDLQGGHDIGAVILEEALDTRPLPVNRSAPTALAGRSIRIVGYGVNDGSAQTGAGIKRTATTTIRDVGPRLLFLGDATHDTCQGDSGGPALATVGGEDTIVGVTSFGDAGCAQGGYDTRVDLYGSFIDRALARGR